MLEMAVVDSQPPLQPEIGHQPGANTRSCMNVVNESWFPSDIGQQHGFSDGQQLYHQVPNEVQCLAVPNPEFDFVTAWQGQQPLLDSAGQGNPEGLCYRSLPPYGQGVQHHCNDSGTVYQASHQGVDAVMSLANYTPAMAMKDPGSKQPQQQHVDGCQGYHQQVHPGFHAMPPQLMQQQPQRGDHQLQHQTTGQQMSAMAPLHHSGSAHSTANNLSNWSGQLQRCPSLPRADFPLAIPRGHSNSEGEVSVMQMQINFKMGYSQPATDTHSSIQDNGMMGGCYQRYNSSIECTDWTIGSGTDSVEDFNMPASAADSPASMPYPSGVRNQGGAIQSTLDLRPTGNTGLADMTNSVMQQHEDAQSYHQAHALHLLNARVPMQFQDIGGCDLKTAPQQELNPCNSLDWAGALPLEKQKENRIIFSTSNKEELLTVLRPYFNLKMDAAARELGCCLTALKKKCRILKIDRWPKRKLDSNLKHIRGIEAQEDTARLVERYRATKGCKNSMSPNEYKIVTYLYGLYQTQHTIAFEDIPEEWRWFKEACPCCHDEK